MSSSACPFCQKIFPLSELERHANNHLAAEELEKDWELAHQIALTSSTTPPRISDSGTNDANSSQPFYGGASTSRLIDNITAHDEEHIHEKISCLFRMQTTSTFYKVEGGLMTLLRRCLELEGGNSVTILVDNVDHFQSLKSEDSGWGCGWRNIQMLTSHLLMQRPDAREVLFGGSGFVPDILYIQRWLEIAWERGFDVDGSDHFNGKVYGSSKWIGTTECATLFRSFGLRARVVDFDSKKSGSLSSVNGAHSGKESAGIDCRGKNKLGQVFGPIDKFLLDKPQADSIGHEKFIHIGIHSNDREGASTCKDSQNKTTSPKVWGHQSLMEWVWNYFSENKTNNTGNPRRVTVSEKTPLYFQHDGHSRTIIGIQAKQQRGMLQQYTLLCLDPGHRTKDLERSLRENVGWQKLIKRGVHTLKKPQYQLCYIDPGIAKWKEMEELKTVYSILVES